MTVPTATIVSMIIMLSVATVLSISILILLSVKKQFRLLPFLLGIGTFLLHKS